MAENKWLNAISKLVELTQDGKLEWKFSAPSEGLERSFPNDRIAGVFTTKYKGRNLRLYERHFQLSSYQYLDDRIIGGEWGSEITLEMYDVFSDAPLWAFPYADILRDLLSAVQYQVAGVKDFVNEILEE
jgi:hypothetical protein